MASDFPNSEVDVTTKAIECGLGGRKDYVPNDIHILFIKTLKADMGGNKVGLKRADLLDEELVVWEAIRESSRKNRDK